MLTARVHAAEAPASFMPGGCCSTCPKSAETRGLSHSCVLYAIPMLGLTRTDPNAIYKCADEDTPAVKSLEQVAQYREPPGLPHSYDEERLLHVGKSA